jgi:aspartate/methionine/tyrosine aminotransferase
VLGATRFAVFINPNNPTTGSATREALAAAASPGWKSNF